MTIDERMEALTQKHEAVTHTLELLAQMHQDNERRYDERFTRVVDVNERLAQITESRERRLNDLER